jgi:hypothetical protein
MTENAAKPIRLSGHARQQLEFRGIDEHEVIAAIREGGWRPADMGRLESAQDFPFHSVWQGVYYQTKRVRPIFVDEPEESSS